MTADALLPVVADADAAGSGRKADPASACVIEIDGRLYIAGLAWRSHLDMAVRLKSAATAGARRAGAKRMVLRERARQYGVPTVSLPPGAAARSAWSLAAVLADSIHGTWVGAWRLPDGRFIVIVVGPSGILPDGDRVFGDETAARDHVETVTASTSWRHLYVPVEWGLAEAKPVPLERLLQQARALSKAGQLQSVESGIGRLPAAAGLAVLLAAGGALWWTTRSPAVVSLPRLAPQSSTPAVTLSWTPAAAGFGACLDAYVRDGRLRLLPGWPVGEYRCDPGLATISLRMEGPVWLLRAAVPDAAIDAMAGTAAIQRPYAAPPPSSWPAGTRLGARADYAAYLRDALERVGGTASLDGIAAPLPGAASAQPASTGPAPALRLKWTVSAAVTSSYLLSVLHPLLAGEMTSAVYTPSSGQWTIQGVLHVDE